MALITKNYGKDYMVIMNGSDTVVDNVILEYRDGESDKVSFQPGVAIRFYLVESVTADETAFQKLSIDTYLRQDGFFLQ